MASSYANMESFEGSTNGGGVINLVRRSRRLTITNDSTTDDLKIKFNLTEEWATLKPTESFDVEFITTQIWISGNNVPYRLWSFG